MIEGFLRSIKAKQFSCNKQHMIDKWDQKNKLKPEARLQQLNAARV